MMMLWFESNKSVSLAQKIDQALAYYNKKYVAKAELCLISEKDAQGIDLTEISKTCGLTVKTTKRVQPGYLHIGTEEPMPGAR